MRATTAPPQARLWRIAARTSVAAMILLGVAAAAGGYHISQHNRAFNMKEITIGLGDVVHFDNDDDFIHQIYIDSPDFNFDSEESYPGNAIDVKFTKSGTYWVRCHIHPKMLLGVTVQ
jgi:plastocyanin